MKGVFNSVIFSFNTDFPVCNKAFFSHLQGTHLGDLKYHWETTLMAWKFWWQPGCFVSGCFQLLLPHFALKFLLLFWWNFWNNAGIFDPPGAVLLISFVLQSPHMFSLLAYALYIAVYFLVITPPLSLSRILPYPSFISFFCVASSRYIVHMVCPYLPCFCPILSFMCLVLILLFLPLVSFFYTYAFCLMLWCSGFASSPFYFFAPVFRFPWPCLCSDYSTLCCTWLGPDFIFMSLHFCLMPSPHFYFFHFCASAFCLYNLSCPPVKLNSLA